VTKILWIDLETSGLDFVGDVILEAGLRITNLNGDTLDQTTELIYNMNWRSAIVRNDFVYDMHTKNGLIDDLNDLSLVTTRESHLPSLVEKRLCNWIDMRLPQLGPDEVRPMAGNSVHLDRGFLAYHMPSLLTRWHYRNLDVSSMREACRMLAPTLFGKMPPPVKAHRPQGDLDESIKLWRWLQDNFFWTEIGEDGSANGG